MKENLFNMGRTGNGPNPSSDGGEISVKFPSGLLIDYLSSYTDELLVDEWELREYTMSAGDPVIFTVIHDSKIDDIDRTPLLLKLVGHHPTFDELSYYLVSLPRELSDGISDHVEFRNGQLVKFSDENFETIHSTLELDFGVGSDNGSVIVGISNEKHQRALGDGHLTLNIEESISYTEMSNWVTRGEEYLVVNRFDFSVTDFHIPSNRGLEHKYSLSNVFFEKSDPPIQPLPDMLVVLSLSASMALLAVIAIAIGFLYDYPPAIIIALTIIGAIVLQIYRTASTLRTGDITSVYAR